jgi:hypothetical protein
VKLKGARILVVGPSERGAMAWFISTALRRLGANVATFDQRAVARFGMPGRPGVGVERVGGALATLPIIDRILRRRSERADMVITVKGDHLDPESVEWIGRSRPFVNWYSDHPIFDQVFAEAKSYTLFCPKDSWSAARLREMGFTNVLRLAHASDPALLGGDGRQRQYEYDVVMLGSRYAYRLHWVRLASSAGYTIGWWGDHLSRRERVGLAKTGRRQRVGSDQGAAFRSGRLVLNTHVPFDVVGGNQRLFDAAAAGCAQLTEDRADSVDALGNDQLLVYSDVASYLDRLQVALGDPRELEEMGRRAREVVLERHTYERRLQELASHL